MMTLHISGHKDLCILLGILLFIVPSLCPAESTKALSFKHLSVTDGLSQNKISCILQDRQGFIWFGTDNGLNRYDGYEFVHYQHKPNISNSLPANDIRILYQDRKGYIWIGTAQGLVKFNTKSITMEIYGHHEKQQNNSVLAQINTIQEDIDDTIWIGTPAGLSQLDPLTQEHKPSALDRNITKLLLDKRQRLWVGTINGLYKLDRKTKTFQLIKHTADYQQASGQYKIQTMYLDSHGNIWIGTWKGLFYFDPDTELLIHQYRHDPDDPQSLTHSSITGIAEDKTGKIWVATNKGINRIDHATRQIQGIYHNPANPDSLSSDNILSLYADENGNIWAGSQSHGVNYWHLESQWFQHIKHNPLKKNTLSHPNVRAIYKKQDELFIGTDMGLDIINLKTGSKQHFEQSSDQQYSLSGNIIHHISPHKEQENFYWISTHWGLNLFDKKQQSFTAYIHYPSDTHSLSDNYVYHANYDPLGQLWVSTRNGLNLYDSKNDHFIRYYHYKNRPYSISDNTIRTFHVSQNHQIWLGTSNGLNLLDPATKTFKRLIIQSQNMQQQNLYHAYDVTAIFQESRNVIWAGYNGEGLHRIDFSESMNNLNVGIYNAANGYPIEHVYSLTLDKKGYFWISGKKGLQRFNLQQKQLIQFNSNDGLQADEFNENAIYLDTNGDIYLGGINGITVFNPNKIKLDSYRANTVITKVNILSEQLNTQAISDYLQLSYNRNSLRFEFALLDYRQADSNTFSYLLEGYHKKWINSGTDNKVAFSNLSHGTYTFRVIGTNKYGYVSNNEASLKIILAPPLWKSNTAYFIYIALILLSSFYYFRWKNKKIDEQETINKRIQKSEEKLKLALWGSDENMWHWDAISDTICYEGLHELLNYSEMKLQNKLLKHRLIIHPDDRKYAVLGWNSHLFNYKDYVQVEYRIQGQSDTWIWIRERGRAVKRDANGMALSISGTYKNITQQKAIDDQLKLFAKAFENTTEAVIIMNTRRKIQAANNAYYAITNYQEHETLHKSVDKLCNQQDKRQIFLDIKTNIYQKEQWEGELTLYKKDHSTFPAWVTISIVRNENNEITHLVTVFSDITERKKSEEDLRRLANYDILTGLPNRTLFDDRLDHAIIRVSRRKQLMAILFLDLDRFKHINDSFGHTIGDLLLQKVAKRLICAMRNEDTLARISGDEFVLLIENINSQQAAAIVAHNLIDCMKRPFQLENQEINVSLSIGVSIFPYDGDTIRTLLKNADTAMYHAKKEGRNNFQFYAKEMNAKALERLTLESALKKAISNNELQLYYQPQVDVFSGQIVGLEALLRWISSKQGIVSPGVFIPLAEESSLIIDIGEWVMKTACAQIAAWKKQNIINVPVAINLSPRQFQRSDLIPLLEESVLGARISAGLLELEITERALLKDIEKTIEILSNINNLGFKLSIDDFGTGYSSLSYLKRFPIHTLKIDQSFIRGVSIDNKDEAIATTIINLGRQLEMEVIAEGVETWNQLEFLRNHNCQIAQGYYFAKPLPVNDITVLLNAGYISPERGKLVK